MIRTHTLRRSAHRHAVGLALLALALIVGLGPGFLKRALPGKKEVVRSVAIKGLVGSPLPFEEYVARMLEEACSEYRRWLQQQRRLHQMSL